MLEKQFIPALLLLGTAASLGAAGFPAPGSQQPASQPAPVPPVHRIAYSPFPEIRVDESCHLLPDPLHPVIGKKKPRLYTDPVICHLESMASSGHREETIVGNELHRSDVRITEQTYVLQNVTEQPAVFVVEQAVPQGWAVDSDPQPVKTIGSTAVFRADAQPGEIVYLHVGLRHTKPLPTKILKKSPLPAAESSGS
jgi:hypothetical protein